MIINPKNNTEEIISYIESKTFLGEEIILEVRDNLVVGIGIYFSDFVEIIKKEDESIIAKHIDLLRELLAIGKDTIKDIFITDLVLDILNEFGRKNIFEDFSENDVIKIAYLEGINYWKERGVVF